MSDTINRPKHYNAHPSGIEAILVCDALGFSVGNTFKYLFRAGLKANTSADEDRAKARWYLAYAKASQEREDNDYFPNGKRLVRLENNLNDIVACDNTVLASLCRVLLHHLENAALQWGEVGTPVPAIDLLAAFDAFDLSSGEPTF